MYQYLLRNNDKNRLRLSTQSKLPTLVMNHLFCLNIATQQIFSYHITNLIYLQQAVNQHFKVATKDILQKSSLVSHSGVVAMFAKINYYM